MSRGHVRSRTILRILDGLRLVEHDFEAVEGRLAPLDLVVDGPEPLYGS